MKVHSIGHGQPVQREDGQWGYTFYINGILMVRDSNTYVSGTANAAKQKMREHVANARRQNGITFRERR